MAKDTSTGLAHEDLAAGEASLLPDREAMSLIGTDPTTVPIVDGGAPADIPPTAGPAPVESGGYVEGAVGQAHDAGPTEAGGSESGGTTTTPDDTHQTIHNTDSASAGT
jgi:hypothetical protein